MTNEMDIAAWLTAELAELLEVDEADIDPKQPLAAYGLSSLIAASAAAALEAKLGRSVDPLIFFDFPCVADLAAHLAEVERAEEKDS